MRSGDVRAMEDRWICRAHPRLIPVTSGPTVGRNRWRTQLPPMPSPRYPSPAIAAIPARGAAAGEQAIADHRDSGPEDQPRSQHQQVGRGHVRLHHMLPYLSDQGQRTGTHSACSRCDSYMKGFQPSCRGTAPDSVEIMECGCQEAADQVTGPRRSAHLSRLHIARPGHRRPRRPRATRAAASPQSGRRVCRPRDASNRRAAHSHADKPEQAQTAARGLGA